VKNQLLYYPTVTRQAYRNMGRITEVMASGKLFEDLDLPSLDPIHDRVMICGSPAMLRDLKHMLEGRGFKEGNTSTPGDFVIERAFAEQ
jgi:ferredoxin--NADP+ reductase